MAIRKGDLSEVQLGRAAQQVNTFVAAPRTARSNTAMELGEALGGAVNAYQEIRKLDVKMDVERATESKLFGGTLFTNAAGLATSNYEEVKGTLDSVEKAQAWYLQSTTPEYPIDDPHALAGFKEAQTKGLGKFMESHGMFLTEKRIEARTRDTLNDFLTTASTTGLEDAYSRLGQIASNWGMDIQETNKITLSAAEYLISQERFKDAEAVLTHKRGAAGTLLSNSATAIDAQKLMAKVQTEDSITVADNLKSIDDATEAMKAVSPAQKLVLDDYLKRGVITVAKRNEMLQANEKAVKIDQLSDTLAKSLSEPGRSFFDPIEGVTNEDAEKARERFTTKFYDDMEAKRGNQTLKADAYAIRNVRFSEQTNTVNPAAKSRLAAGYSAFNPQDVVASGNVDKQTLASVGEYLLMYKANPNVASAYAGNDKNREFYDAIVMDVELGGFEGDANSKLEQALKSYAADAINPLKGGSTIRVNDEAIISAFNTATDKAAGLGGVKASNANQWLPYIKRQVEAASRRTGNANVAELTKHVTKQIVARSQRIGDYLVPRGTNTFVGNDENVEKISNAAVKQYIADNPDEGYRPNELIAVPVVGQQNMWGVTVKGSNQILEIIPHGSIQLTDKPAPSAKANGEAAQIIQDEGVVKNKAGEHVSYNDSEGNLTGGHGHLMSAAEQKLYPRGTAIPQEVVDGWREKDLQTAQVDVKELFGDDLHPEVKSVLTNMAFNLGRDRLSQFNQLRQAVAAKDYDKMAASMRQSKWYSQTGYRAQRLVERVQALNV